MKSLQLFNDEYLDHCKTMTVKQIVQFLEEFRQLQETTTKEKSKLISMKVQPSLLNCFKQQCMKDGIAYQTKIKKLMQEWLIERR